MAKAKIEKKEKARLTDTTEEKNDEPSMPSPPDGGYGWVIVVSSFMCNMCVDGVGYSFGILLPALIDHYHSSKGTTAWVGSIMAGTLMGAGPIVSAVANKFGCRVTCICGCVLAATALTLSVFSPNVSVLMIVYGFIGGLGYGLMYLPAVVMVGYYFESKRSLATGLAVCGSGVGTFTFAPLTSFMLNSFGWQKSIIGLAGITLSCSLFGALMKPLTYEVTEVLEQEKPSEIPEYERGRNSEGNVRNSGVYNSNMSITKRKGSLQPLARKDVLYTQSIQNLKEFQSKSSLAEFRSSVHSISKQKSFANKGSCFGNLVDLSLLKDSVFLVLAVSNLFGMTAFYIPYVYVVELAKSKSIEVSQASILISVIGITNTMARIAIGFLADIPKINNFHVNNICLLMGAITTAAFPLCHSYLSFVAVSVFFGIACAGYISLTSIILVEFLGLEKLTNAFGMIILFRGLASLFGSPLAGTLYDITNSYTVPFLVGGVLFAISAAISVCAPCFKKNKTEVIDGEAMVQLNGVKDEKD